MIQVNFNVINQKGAPSLREDLFANRPSAGQTGRLFVSTDTLLLFRDTGTSWSTIGGGSGGSQNIDNVLSLGGSFTANRKINTNTFDFQIESASTTLFDYNNSTNVLTIGTGATTKVDLLNLYGNSVTVFSDITLFLAAGSTLKTYVSGTDQGIKIINGEYLFGDYGGTLTGAIMVISGNTIYTGNNSGSFGYTLDFLDMKISLGDYDTFGNGVVFRVDDINEEIYTEFLNLQYGLKVIPQHTYLGDFGLNYNGYFIHIDDANEKLILNGTNLLSTSAGSTSSQHLVVTINGTIYKIQLKNA